MGKDIEALQALVKQLEIVIDDEKENKAEVGEGANQITGNNEIYTNHITNTIQ